MREEAHAEFMAHARSCRQCQKSKMGSMNLRIHKGVIGPKRDATKLCLQGFKLCGRWLLAIKNEIAKYEREHATPGP